MFTTDPKEISPDQGLHELKLKPRPIAKLLYCGPFERAENAFSVILGKWARDKHDGNLPKPEIFGILDYLGFGLPFALITLLSKIVESVKNENTLLRYPVKLVCFLLFIPLAILYGLAFVLRPLVAGILTVAVAFPIILLTQPLVRLYEGFVNYRVRQEIGTLFAGNPEKITSLKSSNAITKVDDSTLHVFFHDSFVHHIFVRKDNAVAKSSPSCTMFLWKHDETQPTVEDEYGGLSDTLRVSEELYSRTFNSLDDVTNTELVKQVMRIK